MTKSLQDLIQKIDKSKAQLDELRPIKPEYNTAISQKFQLEFNYHSNHIEGNTLTLGETKNLILRGMEVSIAKKFRDILEMKGHLDAYDTLGFLTERILTQDKLPLRLDQSFIKNLHKIIFVEDKVIHSEEDGIQSVTTIPAGEYKKHQNHVITNTGAKFEYSEPWQVPQMMSDLLDWYNNNRETMHPVILASIFHYKFIRIHPFGDGNGRTARLLMNLILQSSGQVIAMVKSDPESKSSYLNSLSLVDNNFIDIQECLIENNVDLFEPFVIEIGNCLMSSYDIMIRGAKGEDIKKI
jgi:Fic family protein